MRLSNAPVPPDREAAYQAAIANIRSRWTPEDARALGLRLRQYWRDRLAAEIPGAGWPAIEPQPVPGSTERRIETANPPTVLSTPTAFNGGVTDDSDRLSPAEIDAQLRAAGIDIDKLLAVPGGQDTLAELRGSMARILRRGDTQRVARPLADLTYTKDEVDHAVGIALRRVQRRFTEQHLGYLNRHIDHVAAELGVTIPDD